MTDGSLGLAVLVTDVDAAWIDYNDHMTEGAYGAVFADASDALLERAGFDAEYRAHERGTFYTVEAHIAFLREIPATSTIEVRSVVVGADEKRLHLFHTLSDLSKSVSAATQESMLLHVDIDTGRVTPMSRRLREAFGDLRAEHPASVDASELGRGIAPIPGS